MSLMFQPLQAHSEPGGRPLILSPHSFWIFFIIFSGFWGPFQQFFPNRPCPSVIHVVLFIVFMRHNFFVFYTWPFFCLCLALDIFQGQAPGATFLLCTLYLSLASKLAPFFQEKPFWGHMPLFASATSLYTILLWGGQGLLFGMAPLWPFALCLFWVLLLYPFVTKILGKPHLTPAGSYV